jgi:BolA protein|tara:strand:+ start:569 stop:889 length:321 start_codon:yes stop_codon:yes gene_type:complete
MGPVQQIITTKLQAELAPEVLEVLNESYMHAVPPGSESHFKIVIVSQKFDGQRSVKRHQLVYGILASELAGPVHALAMHTYTPIEWEDSSNGAPDSPQCLGGDKSI